MSSLLFEKNGGVGRITLNRPESYNSINRETALAFQAALDACAADENIRAVMITGAGKAFCAGQDLVEVTNPELMPGFPTILREHYTPIIEKITQLPKPVVAAVNGVAAGAGANIALACDIVIATEKASFIQAFSAIGLIPDSAGTYFLPRLIGFQKAKALAMMGDKVSAQEAESMGMIYKFFPVDTFMAEAEKLAAKLAHMPTRGLALTKQAFHGSMERSLTEQLVLENELQVTASETEDYQEGVAAFLEKRKAVFKGK
ncbi:MAG: enoyl-CoA hydratase-related protein [Bacteroidota bacterium]